MIISRNTATTILSLLFQMMLDEYDSGLKRLSPVHLLDLVALCRKGFHPVRMGQDHSMVVRRVDDDVDLVHAQARHGVLLPVISMVRKRKGMGVEIMKRLSSCCGSKSRYLFYLK